MAGKSHFVIMSAPNQPNEKPGHCESRIVFELTTTPALHVEELENFHRLAAARDLTVEGLMVHLIREELASAAAQAPQAA